MPCAEPSTLSPAASELLNCILVEGGGLVRGVKGAAKTHHHPENGAKVSVPVADVSCFTFTGEGDYVENSQSSDCTLGFSPESFIENLLRA